MLKEELKKENEALKKELKSFKENITKALKEVLDNYCSEACGPIDMFCDTIGIPYPTQDLVLRVKYGRGIAQVQDKDYDDLEFEEIIKKDA